ncbi:MAG: hypothetical protein AAF702_39130 [Chloroflexota bacterium]
MKTVTKHKRTAIHVLTFFLLLLATSATMYGQSETAVNSQSSSRQGNGNVFLPLISSGETSGQASTETPTTAPTTASTLAPTPTPTATSTDVSEEQPTSTATATLPPPPVVGNISDRLPNPDADNVVRPVNGSCPDGTHLRHVSGQVSIIDPDTASFDANDYTCEADETAADIDCGTNGTAIVVDGIAACSCAAGYAGSTCSVCAPGFELGGAGQCVASNLQTEMIIDGMDESLEVGQATVLQAKDADGGPLQATWHIILPNGLTTVSSSTTGCLYPLDNDSQCLQSISGPQVGYRAPTFENGNGDDGDDAEDFVFQAKAIGIQVSPPAGSDLPITTNGVVVTKKNGISITGNGDPRLAPIVDSLSSFMKQRCVGSAILGVSRYGYPLGTYGLGRMSGRAGNDWHDYCGDDESLPLASRVTNETPMRIGSANKPVTFAILRWVLKERLKDLDSDVAMTSLSSTRAVTAIRNEERRIKLQLWEIGPDGQVNPGDSVVPQAGSLFFQAREMKLLRLGENLFVLAMRTLSDKLHLSVWEVNRGGAMTMQSIFTLDTDIPCMGLDCSQQITERMVTVKDFAAVALANNAISTYGLAVATRNQQGDLSIWRLVVNPTDEIEYRSLYHIAAAGARDVEITDTSESSQNQAVVTWRNRDGNLQLTTFRFNDNQTITRQDDTTAGAVKEFSVVKNSSNRVVTAVRLSNDNLKLIAWNVALNGSIQRLGDAEAGPVNRIATTYQTTGYVVTAVRTAGNTLKLIAWTIDGAGLVIRQGEASAGATRELTIDALSTSRLLTAVRTGGDKLKVIIFDVIGGEFARLGDSEADTIHDEVYTDAYIESMPLLGYDFPERLLPTRLHRVLSGHQAPPVLIADEVGEDSEEEACADLSNQADTKWQQMRIQHVLGHQMGLPKSAPSVKTYMHHLSTIRGLSNEADFSAQEQILRNEFGDTAVNQGKSHLLYTGDPKVYVLPFWTIEEGLLLVAGRCVRNEVGEHHYSNTSPVFAAAIIEHLLGRPFSAQSGYPGMHDGSALDLFFNQTMGITTSANDNIFTSQRVHGLAGYQKREPASRGWNATGNNYTPLKWDAKRPHCVWNGSSCSFDDWLNKANEFGRLHYAWFVSTVPEEQASSDYAAGASGALAVEPGVYLNFMRNYWVGGYSGNPTIGEKRENTWDLSRSHNGSAFGAYAQAVQYANTDGVPQFDLPRRYNTGILPNTSIDTFSDTESAYFSADSVLNRLVMYDGKGQSVNVLPVNYQRFDGFAVGYNSQSNTPTALFMARHIGGQVEAYHPNVAVPFVSFDTGFSTGDGFAVHDVITDDIFDEVIVADGDTGMVHIYDSVGTPYAPVDVGFQDGDKFAVGDFDGNGSKEFFIGKTNTGNIEIYRLNGSLAKTLAASLSDDDAFAVGDVIGLIKDEIIIARASSGLVDVYNYEKSALAYELYTSFNAYYEEGNDLAVNHREQGLNEILVGHAGYGLVLVLQAEKIDGDYQFFLRRSITNQYEKGDKLGAGFFNGRYRYTCSLPDGTPQDFPDGVDIIVSINQRSDKQCSEAGPFNANDNDSSSCSEYYRMLKNSIEYGLCQVDWSDVAPGE